MCGIFAHLGLDHTNLEEYYNKIRHRGPDNSSDVLANDDIYMGFHRLSINGLDHDSDQPLKINGYILICNGEIYNYEQLRDENGFEYKTHSDCEIIIHMYCKYGIKKTCESLDGVFAFVLYDPIRKVTLAARDPIGIRSMYYGIRYDQEDNVEDIFFCSESKGIPECDSVRQFPPGTLLALDNNATYRDIIKQGGIEKCYQSEDNVGYFMSYYDYSYKIRHRIPEEEIERNIRELLTVAVDKRMLSDRKVCCLLSGGIDSTLITALVNKNFTPYELNTYAIGIKGSVDLYYAKMAADYMKTNHHEIALTEGEFLDAIDETIYQIESFCTTSVRASVGNYLISKYIKNNGDDDTVVFCGDMADEIFASYRGFQKAPDPDSFFAENLKLVKDVHYFDVLRSDKSISGASLEARVPFADKALIRYVMEIDPKLKMFDDKRMEKYLLRNAFGADKLIPDELLWRRKEAFSDGVSHQNRSWFEIIREHVDGIISEEDLEEAKDKYEHCAPYDKESLFYRRIFDKYYPGRSRMIPYYWRHPFCDMEDPSARLLDIY